MAFLAEQYTGDFQKCSDYEYYSELDSAGRCGVAWACVGSETMPTESRGNISSVKPTGWWQAYYNGEVLYNRCHLIGFQLAGENANWRNLITGTAYLNIDGMLPFENEIADYVESSGHHVLYCVEPIFDGDNLVASGVHMQALSVEDGGSHVSFNVYCYNVQPGVLINYADGSSEADGSGLVVRTDSDGNSLGDSSKASDSSTTSSSTSAERTYILNTSTHKFHLPGCRGVSQMSEKNKSEVTATRDELIERGYSPCGLCNP